MRSSWIVILVTASALGVLPKVSAVASEEDRTRNIAHLIAHLGSNRFQEREEAMRALDALGPAVLPALQKAIKSDDAEIACRAFALTRRIEKRMETAEVLAPQAIRLVYKDTPLLQAVEDFKKKTGIPVELGGDRSRLAGRKITLDTGETNAWDALEQLCSKAGLTERSPGDKPEIADGDPGSSQEREKLPKRQGRIVRMQQLAAGPVQEVSQGPLVLVDAKGSDVPTCRSGAVRLRVVPATLEITGQQPKKGETQVALEIKHEPRLRWQNVIQVNVTRAIDDQGQSLQQASFLANGAFGADPNNAFIVWDGTENTIATGDSGYLPVRLKGGSKASTSLRELQGTIIAQVQTPPQTLLTVNDVLKAAGKEGEQNADGNSLKILAVTQQAKGRIVLQVQQVTPAVGGNVNLMGGMGVRRVVRMGGGKLMMVEETAGGDGRTLTLTDARGRDFRLVDSLQNSVGAGAGGLTQEATLTFDPPPGGGEATRLICSGPRSLVIEVPFMFKDVPLSVQREASGPAAAQLPDQVRVLTR